MKTLSRSTLLNHGKYLVVENHGVELPNGRVITDWPWLIMPDYAIVAAVTESIEFLCFRQTKYAVEGVTLALVGGYIEPEEDPFVAARRELLEETGCEAPDWAPLGRFTSDGNRGSGAAYLYLARGARKVCEPDSDDVEDQELLMLGRREVEAALAAGEFKVLAWTTAIALALREMDK
jgi:8-oxo-dGTP pyrophosphatase MutT (NUDIX family)